MNDYLLFFVEVFILTDMYSGVAIKDEIKSGKVILHGTLVKQGSFKGAMHPHNVLFVFEDNYKIRNALVQKKKYLVTFGERHARRSKYKFRGRIDKDVEVPKRKKDHMVITVARSHLLEIISLDDMFRYDKFLKKYLVRGALVSIRFF